MRKKISSKIGHLIMPVLGVVLAIAILCCFSMLFAWLVLNWFLGCCEGGICVPDIYPQCRTEEPINKDAQHEENNGNGSNNATFR